MIWLCIYIYIFLCFSVDYLFCFLINNLQPPKPSDRAQVQLKEVRLPDAGPIPLDDQDVQIVSVHLFSTNCYLIM